MSTYNVSITGATASGRFVQDDHFGANALQSVNVDAHGHDGPTDGFASAASTLGINHFRYPGGGTENVINITKLTNGELRDEVTRFFDWVVDNSTADAPGKVTVVLPTKTNLPAAQIEAFVHKLMQEYGDVVEAFEIGNEYSIGKYDKDYNRDTHPEEDPSGDFVSSMNETEYGIAANRVINATLDAMDRISAESGGSAPDPKILLQIGEMQGAASTFKGNGNFDMANEAIVSWLSPRAKAAVDGGVAHYYYNKGHDDDQAFEHDHQEIRSLDRRMESFNQHLGRDVELYITEWNVLASNYNQLGAASAGILLEQFEFMVQAGVQDAFIWPLQHRTGSNIAGNRQVDEAELTMGGTVLGLMSETLRPVASEETAHVARFESIATDSTGSNGVVEANFYDSDYAKVFYVTLRDLDSAQVNFDISPYLKDATAVTVSQVSIDRATSDGLSDMADDNGQNRIGRRYITEEEYNQLRQLPFFDETNKNHIQFLSNGQMRTYLPTFDSIIPLVPNPRSINDYYFATETDVAARISTLTGDYLNSGLVSLQMMPYDVAQIVIETTNVQYGTVGTEALVGGYGSDVLIGRQGHDTLRGGEANDTLKGGHGNDLMKGGSGNDYIVDGFGQDTIDGGSGNDVIALTQGTKDVTGGAGVDEVRFDVAFSEVTVRVENGHLRVIGDNINALLRGVETLRFSDRTMSAEDLYPPDVARVAGNSGDNVLQGHKGSNLILGGGGSDQLIGGAGLDVMVADTNGLLGIEASEQIFRLYNVAFGRTPDVSGHQNAAGRLAAGDMTLKSITEAFMNSREFGVLYGDPDDAQFVSLLYQNALGRAASASEVVTWTRAMDNGLSRADTVLRFSESQEHINRTNDALCDFECEGAATDASGAVYRIFSAVFGRPPLETGFKLWSEAQVKGATDQNLALSFMNSLEFQQRFGDGTDEEFITNLYQNVLGRAPDASGFENWLRVMNNGLSREEAVVRFANSAEFIASTHDNLTSFIRSMGEDDRLTPGAGDSILSGGLYSDTFVFRPQDDGTHQILDMEAWDTLDLSAFGYNGYGDAMQYFSQEGDTVVFEDQGVRIEFDDLELAQLDQDMFAL